MKLNNNLILIIDLKRENMELTNDLDPPLPVEVISRAQEIHRMHLFRMRLMHFVNSMHNYLMQTVSLISKSRELFALKLFKWSLRGAVVV